MVDGFRELGSYGKGGLKGIRVKFRENGGRLAAYQHAGSDAPARVRGEQSESQVHRG